MSGHSDVFVHAFVHAAEQAVPDIGYALTKVDPHTIDVEFAIADGVVAAARTLLAADSCAPQSGMLSFVATEVARDHPMGHVGVVHVLAAAVSALAWRLLEAEQTSR